jgi:putative membrane protein
LVKKSAEVRRNLSNRPCSTLEPRVHNEQMTGLIQVLGVVFGGLLIVVGVAESFFIRDQRLQRLFVAEPDDVQAAWLGTLNLGFYNVIWGIGAITGAIMRGGADAAAGQALLLFVCMSHVVLGLILFLSERRLWGSAIAEGLLPLIIATLLLV